MRETLLVEHSSSHLAAPPDAFVVNDIFAGDPLNRSVAGLSDPPALHFTALLD